MRRLLLILSMVLIAPLCSGMDSHQQPVTILIHGTLFTFISYYIHGMDCPPGLTKAQEQPDSLSLGKMARILSKAAPEQFPLDSFYLFGWCGKLKEQARIDAALELYASLKQFHNCRLTIIGHSYGAIIALLAAQRALEEHNTSFVIDDLILIACPVQKQTAGLIGLPCIRNIYHLFSGGDLAQVLAPQGFNWGWPVFSQRRFDQHPHLAQAQIFIEGADPSHNDFLLNPAFISNLPQLLRVLDEKRGLPNVAVTIENKNILVRSH